MNVIKTSHLPFPETYPHHCHYHHQPQHANHHQGQNPDGGLPDGDFMSEAKDWAGELISGQTGTGRILVSTETGFQWFQKILWKVVRPTHFSYNANCDGWQTCFLFRFAWSSSSPSLPLSSTSSTPPGAKRCKIVKIPKMNNSQRGVSISLVSPSKNSPMLLKALQACLCWGKMLSKSN